MKKFFANIPVTLCFLLLLTGLNSCIEEGEVGDDQFKQLELDVAAIDDRLATLGLSTIAIKDLSGVRMVITHMGSDLPAKPTSKVKVNYVGKLFSTGGIFDSGAINDDLSKYIKGWTIAFTTLPAGSEAQLYIPSGWAYGNRENGSIPKNSILIFDVTFIDVVESTTEKNQLNSDTLAIDNYLTTKNIQNVVKDSTGLRYVITQEGTGQTPTWYNKLTIKYTIKLLSNDLENIVDTERAPSTAFASRLVDYIHGMKVGLSKMKKGSKAVLYVPSVLAFGAQGASDTTSGKNIPPNTSVIIEIELKAIE